MPYVIAIRSKETGRQGHVPKMRRSRSTVNNMTMGLRCKPLRFEKIDDALAWLNNWNEFRVAPSKTFFTANVRRVHESYFTATGG